MTPASALIAALRQGNLLPPEQLLEAERLAASLSANALAAELVGRGWLTQYQAEELSGGRAVRLPANLKRGTRGMLFLASAVGGLLVLAGLTVAILVAWPGKDRQEERDNVALPGKDRQEEHDNLPNDKEQVGDPLPSSIGMKFVRIVAQKFTMGSPPDADRRREDHPVELTKDFYLGTYEVTQKQYKAVMGYNPSFFSHDGKPAEKGKYPRGKPGGGKDKVKGMDTDDFPVENVSWEDAQEFLDKLNEREKKTLKGWKHRLPSEAEWECACRGGSPFNYKYHFGHKLSEEQANFDGTIVPIKKGEPIHDPGSRLGRTCKVGSYPANQFGLFDMHGNVGEWCHDGPREYREGRLTDPMGPLNKGSQRAIRGGSWGSSAQGCRSASRIDGFPDSRFNSMGFRVALVQAPK